MQTIQSIPYPEIKVGEKYLFVIDEAFCGAHAVGCVKEVDGLDRDEDYIHFHLESGVTFINPMVYPASAYNEPWILLETEDQVREHYEAKSSE